MTALDDWFAQADALLAEIDAEQSPTVSGGAEPDRRGEQGGKRSSYAPASNEDDDGEL